MRDEDLLRMSKQMADFFAPYPQQAAVDGVAGHLRSFWDPRMRRQLSEILHRAPEKLDPVVRAAAQLLESQAQDSN